MKELSDRFRVVSYTDQWTASVRRFNSRLLAGGLDKQLLFRESHIPAYPPAEGRRLFQRSFLIADTGEEVRGGFTLTYEHWRFGGAPQWISHLRLPLSEGVVDANYKSVGKLIFQSAGEQHPYAYTLGMGGFNTAVARRLAKLGWSEWAVPLYFKVFHAGSFLRNAQALRRKRATALVADVAATTGLGGLGLGLLQRWNRRGDAAAGVTAEVVAEFGEWSDVLDEAAGRAYPVLPPRDSYTLNVRYPASEPQFIRLRVRRGSETLGWALLLDTRMKGNKYFGDARVGAIVDGLALPEHCAAVVDSATRFLAERGVDLAVCNHSNRQWGEALRSSGYLKGPSNYVYGASPALAGLLSPFETRAEECFLTRGDGAGPERLMAEPARA